MAQNRMIQIILIWSPGWLSGAACRVAVDLLLSPNGESVKWFHQFGCPCPVLGGRVDNAMEILFKQMGNPHRGSFALRPKSTPCFSKILANLLPSTLDPFKFVNRASNKDSSVLDYGTVHQVCSHIL